MTNTEVMAAIKNTIIEWYSEYIKFNFIAGEAIARDTRRRPGCVRTDEIEGVFCLCINKIPLTIHKLSNYATQNATQNATRKPCYPIITFPNNL